MKNIIITIDGPAGSGKEKISRYISKKWNVFHIDSGVLYRRIAKLIINQHVSLIDNKKIKKVLSGIKYISIRKHNSLRTEDISKVASKIAAYDYVREYVNSFQKKFVKNNIKNSGFVIDGRDIGSVVFKNANLKLYIEVNAKIRAKRRYKQLIDMGEKSIYQKLLKDINLRDKKDKTRKISPLVIPVGSHIIDNNGSFKNTVIQINEILKKL